MTNQKPPQFNPPNPFICSFVTGDSAIDQLSLNAVIAKGMDTYSGYGWDHDTAQGLSELYRAFLYLCKTYPGEYIVPPKEVDDLWHLHILDTRAYEQDCQNIFGYYLHHFPYAGLPGVSVNEHEEERLKAHTLELVKRHFPFLV